METIKIADKEFEVHIADTEELRKIGLSNRLSLEKDEGMLFIYEGVQDKVSFWMKDTYIDLDIIFIDEDGYVISVEKGKALSEKPIIEEYVRYVLELPKGSGIERGDKLEMEEDDEEFSMHILDEKGDIQYSLKNGERIVSRKETKVLIKKAKKAKRTDSDSDYASLGRYLLNTFKKQDNREPEYVNIK